MTMKVETSKLLNIRQRLKQEYGKYWLYFMVVGEVWASFLPFDKKIDFQD